MSEEKQTIVTQESNDLGCGFALIGLGILIALYKWAEMGFPGLVCK